MTVFDFTVGLNLGQIKEAQAVAIEEAIKETGFHKLISTPFFLLFDNDDGVQITINPQQFNFKIAKGYEQEEIEKQKEIIIKIVEALTGGMTAENCIIRFVNVFESENEKAYEALKEKTKFDLSCKQLSDIQTVGYRFLIKENALYDEFKVEPLLREPDKLFIEGIYNRMNVQPEEAPKVIAEAYNNYKEKEKIFTQL